MTIRVVCVCLHVTRPLSLLKSKVKSISDGGRCVAFNPNDDTMFLVGTDEGLIYKCTTEYSSRFLETYPAHNTPIYNISWNT